MRFSNSFHPPTPVHRNTPRQMMIIYTRFLTLRKLPYAHSIYPYKFVIYNFFPFFNLFVRHWMTSPTTPTTRPAADSCRAERFAGRRRRRSTVQYNVSWEFDWRKKRSCWTQVKILGGIARVKKEMICKRRQIILNSTRKSFDWGVGCGGGELDFSGLDSFPCVCCVCVA